MSDRPQFTGAPFVMSIVLPIIVKSPNLELTGWIRSFTQKGAALVVSVSKHENQLRKIIARDKRNEAKKAKLNANTHS